MMVRHTFDLLEPASDFWEGTLSQLRHVVKPSHAMLIHFLFAANHTTKHPRSGYKDGQNVSTYLHNRKMKLKSSRYYYAADVIWTQSLHSCDLRGVEFPAIHPSQHPN